MNTITLFEEQRVEEVQSRPRFQIDLEQIWRDLQTQIWRRPILIPILFICGIILIPILALRPNRSNTPVEEDTPPPSPCINEDKPECYLV